ncbi:hypothetical protein, partial [Streptomyces sp. UNOC14_S4]|uniref:hypothetical protein n=1 Tax=Streptomyces sp. UNOC14_S4 TaxID=2872340 RepID=UPI001E460480
LCAGSVQVSGRSQLGQGGVSSAGSADLRVGAAVAEIEGLYAALRAAPEGPRRDRLLADLARAGWRLADLALAPERPRGGVPPRSRWERRRFLAARGADLIAAFASRGSRRDAVREDGKDEGEPVARGR